ncbi:hypothetical protein Rs2_22513 [Raphanus sativus]|nr:hypothetical protein Rs2_22513 [Raphanus sativus]
MPRKPKSLQSIGKHFLLQALTGRRALPRGRRIRLNWTFSRNHSQTLPPAGESQTEESEPSVNRRSLEAPQTEEGEPSVNRRGPQEAGPALPANPVPSGGGTKLGHLSPIPTEGMK